MSTVQPSENPTPIRRQIVLPPSKASKIDPLPAQKEVLITHTIKRSSPTKVTLPPSKATPLPSKTTQAPKKNVVLPTAKKAAQAPQTDAEEPPVPAVEEDMDIFEPEDHLRSKAMWGGALVPVHDPTLRGLVWHQADAGGPWQPKTPRKGEEEPGPEEESGPEDGESGEGEAPQPPPQPLVISLARPHTPALLKSIDEICVNATDHYMGCRANVPAKRVAKIHTGFDRETGTVTVENDGPGIPITRNERASAKAGRDVYTPEVAMSWVFAGTNLNKATTNVKGGTNGIGAKFATACSVELNVETVSADGRKTQYYLQQFRDRLRVRRPAIVIDIGAASTDAKKIPAERRKPHTRIWFTPAYAELGYKLANGR